MISVTYLTLFLCVPPKNHIINFGSTKVVIFIH
jgi:hypothetical protein